MNTRAKGMGAFVSATLLTMGLAACTSVADEDQLSSVQNAVTALGAPITAVEATHDSHGENGTYYSLTINVTGNSISPDNLRSVVIAAADATTFEFTTGIINFIGDSGEAIRIHETAIEAGIPDRYLKLNDVSIDRFNDTELHELADQLR